MPNKTVLHTAPIRRPRAGRHLLFVVLAGALLANGLGGCAYAPGQTIGQSLQGSRPLGNPYSITTQRVGSGGTAPADSLAANASDVPPPGALMAITPELIRQQRSVQKTALGADVQRLFGEAKPYTIGAADVVNIVVWNHPELVLAPAGSTLTTDASGLASVGNGYNVSTDGLIQFPLLGTFAIAGLTENQARSQLTSALTKYIINPQVTVRVQAFRAGRIYIDGEVRTPGLQAITDIAMTLPEALNRAGGLTSLADRSNIVISRNGATSVINMAQLTALGINPARILLGAGDLLRVGSRDDSKVYVMGEVSRPAALALRNGRLTLNEALGETGGVSAASGDPRQIFVIRSATGANSAASPATPEIYHLDAKSPLAYALAEGFELQARDVVFVDPVPLVLWNRVISLILPSAQIANAARATVN